MKPKNQKSHNSSFNTNLLPFHLLQRKRFAAVSHSSMTPYPVGVTKRSTNSSNYLILRRSSLTTSIRGFFSARNFAPHARLDEDAEAMRWFYFPFEDVADKGQATTNASRGSSPRIVNVKVYQRSRPMTRGEPISDRSPDGGHNTVSPRFSYT